MHMTHRHSCEGTNHASTVSSRVLLEKSQHNSNLCCVAVAMTTPMHQTIPRGLAPPQPLQHFAMSRYTQRLSPKMVCCERRTTHKQIAQCLGTMTIAMQNPCLQCDCVCSLLNSLAWSPCMHNVSSKWSYIQGEHTQSTFAMLLRATLPVHGPYLQG